MTKVALFVTCVGEFVEPEVPTAAVRVLRAVGCDVDVPEGQTCCGQPAWNAGFTEDAARVARRSLDSLTPAVDDGATVVVPAGSCATMMRKYWPQMFELAGDADAAERARRIGARITEFSEFVTDTDTPPAQVDPCSVAVHKSCHMLRELHIDTAPTDLVARVDGCDVVDDWTAADRCCGFGGTFSVKLPETSVAMADEKLDTLPEGVEVIVGSDASCLMHLRTRAEQRGLPISTRHVAEVLADGMEQR